MKTSTVLVLAMVAYLYFQSSAASRPTTGVQGVAPAERPVVQQSGGGDTFNQVMGMITATSLAVAQGLSLASDRNAPK